MKADVFIFLCLWRGRGWLDEGESCSLDFLGIITCLGLQMVRRMLVPLYENPHQKLHN